MMKSIIKKAWLFFVFLALFSCRTEETLVALNPSQSKEYINKSLWKEDEVFIKNVKKVYDENGDEVKMESRYGKIYWDYATSLNTFDESYLIAPILKNDIVGAYVEVRRIGNKVFFGFTEDDNKTNDFFNTLIFTKKEYLSIDEPKQNENNNNEIFASVQSTRVLECKTVTKTLIVGYVEGGGPNQGGEITETHNETICKFVNGPALKDNCLTDYDAEGNCNGGGGNGGGGYSYPNPEEEENNEDCAKIEQIGKNEKTKNLFKNLDQNKNTLVPGTNKYSEKGYLLTENTDGTINETYVEGNAGEKEMSLSVPNAVDGFIHSHYLGLLSTFSVSDLASLSWIYKNGKIKNVNTFVFGLVTASGTKYILTIDNISQFNTFASGLLNSNNQFTEKDKNIHETYYNEILKISPASNGSVNEQRFLAFLETTNSGLKVLKSDDDNFNNWSVLARNPDGTVKSINCN